MFALLNQNQEREEVRNVYNSAAQLRILASNILHAPVKKLFVAMEYEEKHRISSHLCMSVCGECLATLVPSCEVVSEQKQLE